MKGKQLTNIRASGTDEVIRLTPPRELTFGRHDYLHVGDDELVKLLQNLTLTQKLLDSNDRKRESRSKEAKFDFVQD